METANISTEKFTNIHYRKTGAGPAVVLLHGFPEDGMLWEQIIPVLASSFTVVVPDIPGSGGSELEGDEVSVEMLADAIAAILKHEGLADAVVAGHSMGGYVALALAASVQVRLRGISLVHSTAAADTEDKKETRRKSIELIRKGGKEAFVKGMIPNLFAPGFGEVHPDVVQLQVARGMELRAESMIAFYNAMMNRPDRTAILAEVSFPVQWIIGRNDNVIPMNVALQQSRLANINFVSLYNGCGHMSMLEKPERLAHDLKEFIVYCYNR